MASIDVIQRLQNKMNNGHEDNSSQPVRNTTIIGIPAVVETLSTCGVTIGIIAIAFNIIFILALAQLKDKDKPYYRFTKCLSVCDLLGSFSFIVTINFPQGILGFITHNKFHFLNALPYVIRSTPWMFFTGYLLTLTCLAINQYIAICKPWRYAQLVTKRAVTWSLVFVWMISSLQVCYLNYGLNADQSCPQDAQTPISSRLYSTYSKFEEAVEVFVSIPPAHFYVICIESMHILCI